MDDVIILVKCAYKSDEEGNQIEERSERTVYCKVSSTTRSEYYQAAQVDMHPQYIFTLSHYKDYCGEREVKYTDWTGCERNFVITRTYRVPGTDAIELTADERVGNVE